MNQRTHEQLAAPPTPAPPAESPPRRGFLKGALAIITGTLALLAAAVPGGMVLFDPARRKRGSEAGFIPVTTLATLPADGVPRRFPVIADRVDAWNKQPAVPIGAVYLRRTGDAEVHALNVVCPHAGCFVRTEDDGKFTCPCHESEFDVTGKIIPITSSGKPTVSPRDLDPLEVRIEGDRILVKFQNFQAGSHDRIPS